VVRTPDPDARPHQPHQPHAVVVVGASAGGVEALRALTAGLPADLPAAVLVVLHLSANTPSVLPRILGRACALPVAHARNGEPLEPGRVYVACPDQHLLVHPGRLRLLRGARENGVRPAVDPLFRTAARAYGPRVIGVVLSGTLDDGTLGLGHVKRWGGTAVVQDPEDALFDGMPRSAIEHVLVDHVAPAQALGPLLARLARRPRLAHQPTAPAMPDPIESDRDVLEIDGGARRNEALGGRISGLTCPECHGALWEMGDGEDGGQGAGVRFRCRVGHAFSEQVLHETKGVSIEAALWTALTALEEHAALTLRMAQRAGAAGHEERHRRYHEKVRLLEQRARVIHDVLHGTPLTITDGADDRLPVADVGAP
jgi:two-component system chemotaxis response regulator CheB